LRAALQDRRELALVVGRQVHDDDVGNAEIGRHHREERAQGVDAAGRRANADDSESRRCVDLVLVRHTPPFDREKRAVGSEAATSLFR
jgi:hypothetical protein